MPQASRAPAESNALTLLKLMKRLNFHPNCAYSSPPDRPGNWSLFSLGMTIYSPIISTLPVKGLPGDAQRANIMAALAYHLSSVGRHEEAVTAVREAVDLRRALAADQPAAFNAPLASSLFNMAVGLAAVTWLYRS
ncbi:hypothetical protein FIBSPDRAFT_954104 [Athelia psychrophila]|uniref:Uncharacterized protein n=1 Tax=Athelia psychrophila TaxID=1759441 RepID=A0A166JIW2_9AGAM|nr:hypothetical protein FIBSPDRAFT_954104 [Fibularhizoctonia sp. CBS 109695]